MYVFLKIIFIKMRRVFAIPTTVQSHGRNKFEDYYLKCA
jgi:hypothetical protein